LEESSFGTSEEIIIAMIQILKHATRYNTNSSLMKIRTTTWSSVNRINFNKIEHIFLPLLKGRKYICQMAANASMRTTVKETGKVT